MKTAPLSFNSLFRLIVLLTGCLSFAAVQAAANDK